MYIAGDLKCRAFGGVGNVWGKQGHLVNLVSTGCALEGVGSAYSVCVEEKVVRGHVKPRSNVVVGRNGGHLSGDIVDGLIDWRGRWRRMEVLK